MCCYRRLFWYIYYTHKHLPVNKVVVLVPDSATDCTNPSQLSPTLVAAAEAAAFFLCGVAALGSDAPIADIGRYRHQCQHQWATVAADFVLSATAVADFVVAATAVANFVVATAVKMVVVKIK